MRHVVIGAGEVGTAIAEVLRECYEVLLHDLGDTPEPVQVMHVCFPWSDSFERDVQAYRQAYQPTLVIIHSTVPVGTTRRLGAVHSPVTGKHPHLARSVRTFTKFFGGARARDAAAIFTACGVRSEIAPSPEDTELGKLWQTLQYGWLIALQKESRRAAEKAGADPEFVYDRMNQAYNEGYHRLGEAHFLPTLRDVPGKIGGHCVIPNTMLTDGALPLILAALDDRW